MKALIAMSLFICLTACTKPGGKGSAQGDEAPATGEETGGQTTTSGSSPTPNNPTSKNDKDVETEATPGAGTGATPGDSSGNTNTGSTDPGSGSGSGTSNPGSTPADTDMDGVTDDQDVCPGENDALQVTRYKLTDADSDNYADGSLSAKVCPSNTVYTLTLAQVVYSDCDSTDSTKWQTLAYSHRDADNDGHSTPSSGSICTGAALPAGYLTSSLGTADCDDSNPSYHTVAPYYSYTADATTSDRYTRLSESACVPSSGYGSVNAYKEYRLVPNVISNSNLSNITGFIEFGGKIYFQASNATQGIELWVSDGTIAGTSMIKDINAGAGSSIPENFIIASGKLYFTADDGSGVSQLWTTDGTSLGTVKVKSIAPTLLTVSNGILFFVANDGVYGSELWKTDGTSAGTVVVKDIRSNSLSSSPKSLTNLNGVLYFTADDDGTGDMDLWKSDGTDAGTVKVKDLNNISNTPLSNFIAAGDKIFFTVKVSGYGRELWKSDGTSAGTIMVKDIRVGNGDSFVETLPSNFVAIDNSLYFVADDGASGKELWKSDGTEAGTVMIKDIWSGSNGSLPDNLTNVNGTLFFTAENSSVGTELWKSNGTEAGTVLIKDIHPSSGITLMYPSVVGSTFYFSTDDDTHGIELWKSDGTETGTILTKDINSNGDSSPSNLAIFGNQLIFSATTPDGIRIHLTPAPL
jgi:ELWxxDGT repeat protein